MRYKCYRQNHVTLPGPAERMRWIIFSIKSWAQVLSCRASYVLGLNVVPSCRNIKP